MCVLVCVCVCVCVCVRGCVRARMCACVCDYISSICITHTYPSPNPIPSAPLTPHCAACGDGVACGDDFFDFSPPPNQNLKRHP